MPSAAAKPFSCRSRSNDASPVTAAAPPAAWHSLLQRQRAHQLLTLLTEAPLDDTQRLSFTKPQRRYSRLPASRSRVTFTLFTYSSLVRQWVLTVLSYRWWHNPAGQAQHRQRPRRTFIQSVLGFIAESSEANGVQAPRQLFARRPGLANPANGAHLLQSADRRAPRHSRAWFDCMALSTLIVTDTGTANREGPT